MKKIAILLLSLGLLFLSACSNDENRETINKQFEDPKIDKILVIGNSFSNDALTYFYDIVSDNEIEPNLILGHIDIGGSSLETHRINALTDYKDFSYQKTTSSGKETLLFYTMKQILQDEAWDIVTIQQVSGKSGVLNTYNPHFNDLVNFIKKYALNKDVKIGFHMTWAYQETSGHQDFVNYSNNQVLMYESIVYVMENLIAKKSEINYIIPSGTVIQNLRNSLIGDNLTRDGYHLNQFGQYAVGIAWIKYLFEVDLESLKIFDNKVTEEEFGAIKEAVENMMIKPFEVTESTLYPAPDLSKEVRYMNKLNLLAIGNSFTADSFVYLADMLKDIGVEEFKIAYLYIGGTSLAQHGNNLRNDSSDYEYREWTNNGNKVLPSYKASRALKEEMWDIVVIQQVSGSSGVETSYVPHLKELIYEIRKVNPNPNTKIAFHMTWAYAKDSDHWEFPNYNNNQATMYDKITKAVQSQVVPNEDIDFLIPSGTAIQNVRETKVGDKLTRDGYHLNGMGQYIAGMMWVKAITNINLDLLNYVPVGLSIRNYLNEIKQAVNDAYETPFEVSEQSGVITKPDPEPDLPIDDMEKVAFDYALGFWLENATKLSVPTEGNPNALHNKYVGVSPISKNDLPIGSVINLGDGYQIRIIYFTKTGDTYKVVKRTDTFDNSKL
ncbi:MAG: DUF4886 domain-containing protein, partial [Acholeplasmataceae bacterium]|nr:DUF4886 domain-containing protein [Acholeplasmataceae bacterium]